MLVSVFRSDIYQIVRDPSYDMEARWMAIEECNRFDAIMTYYGHKFPKVPPYMVSELSNATMHFPPLQ